MYWLGEMATFILRTGKGSIRDMTSLDWSQLLGFSSVDRSTDLLRIHDDAHNLAVFRGSNFSFGGAGPGGLNFGTITSLRLESAGQTTLDMTRLSVSGAALASAYGSSNNLKVSELLLSGSDLVKGSFLGDTLTGYGGADTIHGLGGSDKIFGGRGNDRLFGGAENDTLLGEDGNDLLVGGSGNDTLYGRQGADTLQGDSGDDELYGENDSDLLNGGSGNDIIYAGTGNDTASGGDGNDMLYGEAGADSLAGNNGHDSIFGGIGDETILGGAGNDRLYGEAGNDWISGGVGDDWIAGGAGNDRMLADSGDDVVYAEAGADLLYGGTGKDRLYGGAGNDTIYGGASADSLYGGAGADVFYFTNRFDSIPTAPDFIDDFSSPQRDRINLTGIDSDLSEVGNQRFLYIGSEAFSREAGELRWVRTANATYVQADLDGDAIVDFTIHIGKSIDLHSWDFFL